VLGLDAYTIRARVAPALLVALPVWITVTVWFPGVTANALVSGAGAWLALAVLADQLGRDGGRNKQPDLLRRWGGLPSTAMLRHRDPRLNRVTRARYHAKLGVMGGVPLPTPEIEAAGAEKADEVYESCIELLRARTRDHKTFALVFAENVAYGFRRNVWGMRPGGATLALLASAACGVRLGVEWMRSGAITSAPTIGLLACAVLSALWLVRFTSDWVKVAAEAYARALLAACEVLESPRAAPSDVG
jgi:hypothetical protein